MVEQSKKGLVLREREVKRGGKTFKRKMWVKPGEDEPEEREGKKVDLISKLKIGDIVNVGGKLSKVKTINEKSKTVMLYNEKLGNEVYDFDDLNKKGKLETPEGKFKDEPTTLGTFEVGQELSMMGAAVTIEKVSESEKTIKMSDGKVYTLGAIKRFGKPLAESKYKEGDKLIFNGEEKIVKRVNRAQEVIEFNDGKFHTFDDIELFSEEPKKPEIKAKPKVAIKKEPKVEVKKPEVKTGEIVGSTKDGSLSAKERKLATENMEKFVTELREKEGDIDNNDRVSKAGNYYTKGNCIEFNRYLLSDKKKGMDYETMGLKDITKDEKSDLDKRIKILDEFLDKAPKVKGTSYRAMWWNPNNPEQKENFDNFIKDLVPGTIVENKPYSSTTTSKKMMKEFTDMAHHGDIIAEVEYEGHGVYLGEQSKEPGQLEVLYKQGIKFEVASVDRKENKVNIKFREVGYE